MLPGIVAGSRRRTAAGGGADPLSPDPHAWWRINVERSGTSTTLYLAEIEFRGTAGGADQATGGTAMGSANTGSTANAFDDSLTSNANASSPAYPAWFGYQFPSPVSVAEVALTSDDYIYSGQRSIHVFTIDWSDDGVTWTAALAPPPQPSWGQTETRLFRNDPMPGSGSTPGVSFEPGAVPAGWSLSNGGRTVENVSAGEDSRAWVRADRLLGTLPRYWEVSCDAMGAGSNHGYCGVVSAARAGDYDTGANPVEGENIGWRSNGTVWTGGAQASGISVPTWGAGDVLMFYVDADAGRLWFGLNGSWRDDIAVDPAFDYYPSAQVRDQGDILTIRGEEAQFSHPLPPGVADLARNP